MEKQGIVLKMKAMDEIRGEKDIGVLRATALKMTKMIYDLDKQANELAEKLKEATKKTKLCPICREKEFNPDDQRTFALSRKDSKRICTDCGQLEALDDVRD